MGKALQIKEGIMFQTKNRLNDKNQHCSKKSSDNTIPPGFLKATYITSFNPLLFKI